ncbi:MAG: hypothetical protein ABUT20_54815, partial [Bacteroidota bacterium]
LILIDGRARTSCIKHAVGKLKPSGFLILDNAERKYYTSEQTILISETLDLVLDALAPVAFSPDFSQTRIWQKKNHQ